MSSEIYLNTPADNSILLQKPFFHSFFLSAAYCNWRSEQEGYQQLYDACDPNWPCDFSKIGYRLPTEAEWECAACGGEHNPYYRFPWGDTITHSQANYYSSSPHSYGISPTRGYHPTWNDGIPYTSSVGSFAGNGYGLYDMAGNVWEWTSSCYYAGCDYGYCVIRGGSWGNDSHYCPVSNRYFSSSRFAYFSFGFRVCR